MDRFCSEFLGGDHQFVIREQIMKAMVLTLLLFTSSTGLAENTKSLEGLSDTSALTETVMGYAGKNRLKEALLTLKPYHQGSSAEFDVQIDNADSQIPAMRRRFGDAIGYELIQEETAGDSIIRYTYIQKMERHAMVWFFVFYKPGNEWILDSWYFNDNIEEVF
jgi:hypothetical protein